jgi:hypothetical protein
MEISEVLTYITPVLTALGGWWAGRKKQRNDFISELQASIDLLAEKNRSQMEEIIKLRNLVVDLTARLAAKERRRKQ